MKLSDLLGVQVRTEAGETVGKVRDLRAELTPRTVRVNGVVVGGLGRLERLGIGAPKSAARIRTKDVIPWTAVVRADARGIVVRDDFSNAA